MTGETSKVELSNEDAKLFIQFQRFHNVFMPVMHTIESMQQERKSGQIVVHVDHDGNVQGVEVTRWVYNKRKN